VDLVTFRRSVVKQAFDLQVVPEQGLQHMIVFGAGENNRNQLFRGDGGCGDFGFHIMDTRDNQETLWYFKMGASGRRLSNWDTVMNCLTSNELTACTQYAEKWMSQSYLNQTKRVEFV